MGERLVFNMFRGHQPNITQICSIHFHWSAYTQSVYEEAKMLFEGLKKRGYNINMSDHETIQLLIDTVQENVIIIPKMVVPPRPGTGEEPTIIPERMSRGGILDKDIEFATASTMYELFSKRPVWFLISEKYGEYRINMFYDNEYNHSDGEDL